MAKKRTHASVNNAFYDTLDHAWIQGDQHPVALLRAEAPVKLEFVLEELRKTVGIGSFRILDLGCGAGFLANSLARQGHRVTGIDTSPRTLEVARQEDAAHSVRYEVGDATKLSFPKGSFDVVCAMDLLEHLENPRDLVREAARVLRPGGLFIFHTFNRTFLSWLLAVKGLEWFVENTPPRLHLHRLFVRPSELDRMCNETGLRFKSLVGIRPVISKAFFELIRTHRVPMTFRFRRSRATSIGYMGAAQRA